MTKSYSGYGIFVSSAEYIRPEYEYIELWPGIGSFKFTSVIVYKNGILFYVECSTRDILYDNEYAVYCAIANNNVSLLTSDELTLYNTIKSIAESCKAATQYETIKNVHDYLVLNIAYDTTYNAPNNHNAYGALINKTCVCDGYTKAFSLILKALNIDTVTVTGTADNGSFIESHAWNKVCIDNEWYQVDVTWDDPAPDVAGQIRYDYFCLTDDEISADHFWDNTNLPIANSYTYNYNYNLYKDIPHANGLDELIACVDAAISEKQTTIEILETTGDFSLSNAAWTHVKDTYIYYGRSYKASSCGIHGVLYTFTITYP